MGEVRLSRADFARACGVNKSTVTRWVQTGRITVDDDGLIDARLASRQREATESPLPHHQARKVRWEEDKRQSSAGDLFSASESAGEGDASPTVTEVLGQDLKRATVSLQQRKAELAAIEIDRLAGTLVARTDVDYVLADVGATVRNLLQSLPDRLSGELAAHHGDVNAIHKALEDASRELLLALGAHLQRRAGGLIA